MPGAKTSKDNFLVINFLDDCFEINALRVDFTKKEIILLSRNEEEYGSRDKFTKIFHQVFPLRSYKIILALDSKRALTNFENIPLSRDNPREKINEADMENLISQALWKIFDDGRQASARQLGLNDLEILLSDTYIHDFKIDGRRVINHLNHQGKTAEVQLSQTFTNRSFFDQILAILPKRAKLVFIIESGVAASHLLSKISKRSRFLFAKVMADETDVFGVNSAKSLRNRQSANNISFLDYVKWGANQLYKALGKELRVAPAIAKLLIDVFFNEEVSPAFEKRFERILSGKITSLTRGLRNTAAATKSDFIYLDFPGVAKTPLRREKIFPKMILPIASGEMLEAFGFKLDSANNDNLDFLSTAALLEFYFLPPEDLLNRLAKRRMRWLMKGSL